MTVSKDAQYAVVTVDSSLCQGHGECERVTPDVFSLSDELTAQCAPRQPLSLLDVLEHACSACPAGAISVEVRP
ncbi:ferredoxin [Streptomyces sp. NPDC051322]|uniref:ferredoxin n=1 Tax=Streptomyces sp. NPDC051322 TaxID=3154645 RepID=UPI0034504560